MYFILSSIAFFFLFTVWSKQGMNIVIKFALLGLAIFGTFEYLVYAGYLINEG